MGDSVTEVQLSNLEPDGAWLAARFEAAIDSGAHVVLLDGAGELPEATGLGADALREVLLFELPVVFCFERALRGSWTDLALAADIRVCGEGASLQGRLTGNARVRSLTDEATALELFLGRTALPAERLLEVGLVSGVTPQGTTLAEGRRLAAVIASRGPIAIRLGKEAIWRGLGQPLEQALRFETDLTLLLQTTKDRAEGVRAFLEKRPPRFAGE